jgi:hypothetical protein
VVYSSLSEVAFICALWSSRRQDVNIFDSEKILAEGDARVRVVLELTSQSVLLVFIGYLLTGRQLT